MRVAVIGAEFEVAKEFSRSAKDDNRKRIAFCTASSLY